MRNHAANGTVENLRGCTVVEGARFFRVDNVTFVKEIVVSQLGYTNIIRTGNATDAQLQLSTLLRKKLPEMLISSHRTTTIFWPLRICFEIMEARRPRRWPLPSMTMGVEEKVAMASLGLYFRTERVNTSEFGRDKRRMELT